MTYQDHDLSQSQEGPESGMPPDPLNALTAGSAQMYGVMLSLVAAGFTENQALYLIGKTLETHL